MGKRKRGEKRNLTDSEKHLIVRAYEGKGSRKEIQKKLSKKLDITPRSVRNWAKKLGVGVMAKNVVSPAKVMIYDIETSRVRFWGWWTGKQYVSYHQLIDEPTIITVSWKWLGSDKVHCLTWGEDHSDKQLMIDFLKEYNKADMVIGYNNDNFDNRFINARAMKYNLDVNTFVKSYDIMKEEKKVFRVPSYSMDFMAKYSNVIHKQGHEGLLMWNMIQTGTKEQQEEFLGKMVDYNVGDIAATEELYIRLRKYFGHRIHLGVLYGNEKFSCPDTGSLNVEFERRTVTPAGTVQIIMKSNETGARYKVTNKQYMSFLDYKLNQDEVL
jgi:DNA polymerase elongation subunit (family B)